MIQQKIFSKAVSFVILAVYGCMLLSTSAWPVSAANGTTTLQADAAVQTAWQNEPAAAADPVAQDQEFMTALSWMREKGLTRFSSPSAYAPYDLVTREQAAKFYSEFSVNILYKIMDMNKYCEFDDLAKADKTLKNSILVSCMLSLFKWTNGSFFPKQQFTKAQAIAVLIRSTDGILAEDTIPRWKAYYEKAISKWLIKPDTTPEAMDKNITRYEMALLLYRAGSK